MRKVLASIALVSALAALAPVAAEAGGSRGPRPSGPSSHSFRSYPFPFPYCYRPYYYRLYYYRPYYYYSPYYAPQPYVAAPGSYSYSAPPGSDGMSPAPEIQREVVFPEGRYVLLGDGDAVPFRWVWVPSPPTGPPADTQDSR